jgi:hypothetical protein
VIRRRTKGKQDIPPFLTYPHSRDGILTKGTSMKRFLLASVALAALSAPAFAQSFNFGGGSFSTANNFGASGAFALGLAAAGSTTTNTTTSSGTGGATGVAGGIATPVGGVLLGAGVAAGGGTTTSTSGSTSGAGAALGGVAAAGSVGSTSGTAGGVGTISVGP